MVFFTVLFYLSIMTDVYYLHYMYYSETNFFLAICIYFIDAPITTKPTSAIKFGYNTLTPTSQSSISDKNIIATTTYAKDNSVRSMLTPVQITTRKTRLEVEKKLDR